MKIENPTETIDLNVEAALRQANNYMTKELEKEIQKALGVSDPSPQESKTITCEELSAQVYYTSAKGMPVPKKDALNIMDDIKPGRGIVDLEGCC